MTFEFPESPEQLRDWAYHPELYCGTGQAFQLAAADIRFADVLRDCASDAACPNQVFLLRCLYLIAGNAIRSDFNGTSRMEIIRLTRQAEKRGAEPLLEFVWRTREVLDDTSGFDFDRWCSLV